jgi:hypothetical protein
VPLTPRTRALAALGTAAALAFAGLAAAAPASAATFTVTNGNLTGAGSLGAAIDAANAAPDADVITIAPGVVITMTTTEFTISNPVTIVGDAGSPVQITGPTNGNAIFDVSATLADFELDHAVLKPGGATGGAVTTGGGHGSLTLDDVTASGFGSTAVDVSPTTGTVRIADSTFDHDHSGAFGSALDISPADGGVTITGSTFTNDTTDQDAGAVFLRLTTTGPVTVTHDTFDHDSARDNAGAFEIQTLGSSADISDDVFSDDTSGTTTDATAIGAGALQVGSVTASGSLTMERDEFRGDQTALSNGTANFGGAVYLGNVFGTVTVQASTFDGNGFFSGGTGTGVGVDLYVSDVEAGVVFTVMDSTFDETAAAHGTSDLFFGQTDGDTVIQFATVFGPGAIGIGTSVSHGARVADTIAESTSGPAFSVTGVPVSLEYSITSDAAGPAFVSSSGDQLGVADPQLAALASNTGGATPTRTPLPGSPAIDAANPTAAGTDQLGNPRVQNGRADIGAVETAAVTATTPTGTTASASAPTLPATGIDAVPVLIAGGALLGGGLALLVVLLLRRPRRGGVSRP